MIKNGHLACVLLPPPPPPSLRAHMALSLHITKDALPRDVGTACPGELCNPHPLSPISCLSFPTCRIQFVPGEDELLTPRRKG